MRSFSASSKREVEGALSALGLSALGVNSGVFTGKDWVRPNPQSASQLHEAINPATGEVLARVCFGTRQDYDECVANATGAFRAWAATPAPVRGDVVGKLGDALRGKKDALGTLLALEMGKIKQEGLGEVQEFIDVCDMARGMSRAIPGGKLLPSERPKHLILETWNPLGVVGIITAFNFPHAVFGWNSAVSLVCGNTQIVKGAETASLVSIATQRILVDTLVSCGVDPAVAVLCQGRGDCGEWLSKDDRVKLVSFTGSTRVGKLVAQTTASRLAPSILELGGNNASIVLPDADMSLALTSVLFSAVGTCAQRCTSLRRLLLHQDCYDDFVSKLVGLYAKVKIGDPLDATVLCGPLHTAAAVQVFLDTVDQAKQQGGRVLFGGRALGGHFVEPAIVEISSDAPIVNEERFVPVLYVIRIKSFEHGVAVNNQVKQGLTSSLFTQNMKRVFDFVDSHGSDCGIANINTSCSGAEIGGAFGGNKETGGGRESGSDAWKQYMRRGTSTVNFGDSVPLAQGIQF